MMAYTGYGSRREYSGSKAKRYDSSMIARAWARQESADGRCPAAMTFDGGKFYSYSTCIAEITEYNGKTIFWVSTENYSSTTAQHLGEVRSAVGGRPYVFHVPGVNQGGSNLGDLTRILSTYQGQIERKLTESAGAQREVKRSRLIVEAFKIVLEMRKLAQFFHVALDEYTVKLPAPHKSAVDEATYVAIIATRLADPSPWMREPESGVMVELPEPVDSPFDVVMKTRPSTMQAQLFA